MSHMSCMLLKICINLFLLIFNFLNTLSQPGRKLTSFCIYVCTFMWQLHRSLVHRNLEAPHASMSFALQYCSSLSTYEHHSLLSGSKIPMLPCVPGVAIEEKSVTIWSCLIINLYGVLLWAQQLVIFQCSHNSTQGPKSNSYMEIHWVLAKLLTFPLGSTKHKLTLVWSWQMQMLWVIF